MQLLPNDIIIRKYKEEETLWVSQRLVMQVCGVTEDYLRKKARPNYKKSIQSNYKQGDFLPYTGTAWRWGKANGFFYYEFDCLPDRAPTHYRSQFGTKHELLQAYEALQSEHGVKQLDQIKELIKAQVDALFYSEDIRYYIHDAPIGFNQLEATDMALARAWCLWMVAQLENDNFKKLGITKIKDFYQICTDLVAPLELEGFKINSPIYFRNKIRAFSSAKNRLEQLNFFISGKYGNNNAQIVGKTQLVDESTGQIYAFDYHQALMFQLYMNPGSSTKEYIHSLHQYYIEDIKGFGLEPVSYRTFCSHLTRFNKQIKLARGRHGIDYYRKHVETYVTTERLKYAHSLFAGDGSGTINYKYKKNGKWATMKLYVMTISDVASRYITGWAVAPVGSHKETPEMVQEAVKMAINNSDKQTMFEFISDNHGAFTSSESKEFLNLVFNKVRTIEPGNSQANPAETQFRLFKRSLKDLKNFISTSWDAGLENTSNPDFMSYDNLPTYEDAVIQFYEVVRRWNQTALRDGVSPAERFENKNPKCEPMHPAVLRFLFGKHTEVDISYMRGYVNVSKTKGYDNVELFQFEIPEFGGNGTELIAKATGYMSGAKVKVVWNEDFADLYTLDGKFIITCPRALKASQAYIETTNDHFKGLDHHLERKKNQSSYVDEFEDNLNELVHGLGYSHTMALGGNKESYNTAQLQKEAVSINKTTKRKVDREFNSSEWSNLNN